MAEKSRMCFKKFPRTKRPTEPLTKLMKISPSQGKTVKFKNTGDKRSLLKAERGREAGQKERCGEREKERGSREERPHAHACACHI